ncbi:MAG: hypothetical protein JST61_07650 [Acidobacteria bacterium]|nr:hypothetical protein [Acidobacteriota bacterium]
MRRIPVIAGILLLSTAGLCQTGVQRHARPLNDAALDRVTAGKVTAALSDGVVKFQGQTPTANGLVTSSGTLAVENVPLANTMGTLTINGNAQQNLSSLININAVNSKINVLLNLNVNINSTVGTLTQSNLNGKH